MSRPRPQRTRIYVGCEGESEQSYVKRLNEIADAAGLHLHLDNDLLRPGGGNPLAIMELAVQRISIKKKSRGDFAHQAVLLDRDKLAENPDWEPQVASLARKHGIHLIWQNPCHEAFLLRHLAGMTASRPQSSGLAGQALRAQWPEFFKNMPASQLAARIDLVAVRRAVSEERGLAEFLERIGFR
jgi:hypothetical protein